MKFYRSYNLFKVYSSLNFYRRIIKIRKRNDLNTIEVIIYENEEVVVIISTYKV